MEEWEYHFAGSATQSVRGLMAKVCAAAALLYFAFILMLLYAI
jgi:hypothetical protein